MIPRIDFQKLAAGDTDTLQAVASGARDTGFLLLENTPISAARQQEVLAAYLGFFRQDPAVKSEVDMACTGANRGWGASRSEQVDPVSNPD